MCVAIYIARAKDKTAAKLKGIPSKTMLSVPGSSCAFTGYCIVFAKDVQHRRAMQLGCIVGLSLLVNQKGEGNAGFLAKESSVVHVAQADR